MALTDTIKKQGGKVKKPLGSDEPVQTPANPTQPNIFGLAPKPQTPMPQQNMSPAPELNYSPAAPLPSTKEDTEKIGKFNLPKLGFGPGEALDPNAPIQNDPYRAAMGLLTIPATAGPGLIGQKLFTETAAKESSKVGVIKTITKTNLKTGAQSVIQINTVTEQMTGTLFQRLAQGLKDPQTISSSLLASIGSYPFAGFIKEEALQTLGMGMTSAYWNNDVQGMEESIAMQKEILNPSLWEKIIAAVPYANVIKELKDFYSAAALKSEIDSRIVANKKAELSDTTGTTKASELAKTQEENDYKANTDYYNEQRIKTQEIINQINADAKAAQRAADKAFYEEEGRYWAKQKDLEREKEAADRLAIARFWAAYKRRQQQLSEDNRPSALNFGLV